MYKYTNEFRKYAIKYYLEHKELSLRGCSANLGVSKSALSNWLQLYQKSGNEVFTRNSGNYVSDEVRKIDKLKKELRDTKDALDILKKAIHILEK